MARSHRRTPVVGMTTATSDKAFKAAEHRRERRSVRTAVKQMDEIPDPKLFGDPCHSEKDGKQWLDPSKHEELMRK